MNIAATIEALREEHTLKRETGAVANLRYAEPLTWIHKPGYEAIVPDAPVDSDGFLSDVDDHRYNVRTVSAVADEFLAWHQSPRVADSMPNPWPGRPEGIDNVDDLWEEITLRREIHAGTESFYALNRSPFGRNRDVKKEGASEFVRRMSRQQRAKRPRTPDGIRQADYWLFPADDRNAVTLVTWIDPARKAGKASGRSRVRKGCGHPNPYALRVDGRWQCKSCRNRWNYAKSAARKGNATALASIREWHEQTALTIAGEAREEEARAFLAEQRARLARGNNDAETHA